MDKKKIFAKVQSVVADQLDDVDKSKITPQTNIKKDLDLDSLDIFEIVDDLEDAYDIEINTDQDLDTVDQFVDYIADEIQKKQSK
ncbi:acyl carrier protein [Acetilactobacillus jinshanensis]|uniref:Acyl carrier protein n=1 Tax=Acetilactobacillus jinshanensis TaxID=1720083 RepID=A0A4P6ZJA9_9LACO|nr:acyl carrier protein [Acetilactobacillus jinshanensis]QBP17694.1 acyl carrier protein [Acetilactobacillus jinshanensis]URL61762.1 acyl carrier protein [uncultured bacterium]